MPSPLVVVQNDHAIARLTGPIAEAAREMGIALHDVSYGTDAPAVPEGGPWGPILVMGSILFVDQWARDRSELAPWVFWDDSQYDAELWAERLDHLYLNANGYATTVGAFAASGVPARHIRPRSGIKLIGDKLRTEDQEGRRAIPGLVLYPEDVTPLNIDPTIPIWASVPKDILAEVRVWMIGGRPVAGSTYRMGGKPHFSTDHRYVGEAMDMARRCHGIWSPDRHYVVDMAFTGEGIRVVEYNPIHAAGRYAIDPAVIIAAFMTYETQGDQA